MRTFILSCFMLALCSGSFAQTTGIAKYWDYRDLLQNDFLIVGDGKGMSSPAAYRNEIIKELKWADNGIYLGWYIALLASEYKLLHDDRFKGFDLGVQQRAAQNIIELQHAIACAKRLDVQAESAFKDTCGLQSGIANGFFIRDDVPGDFHNLFPNIENTLSDFTATDPFDKEMSQDQAYHLLMGLALVKELIPANLSYNGVFIRQEATEQGILILNWIKRDWEIRNPACTDQAGNIKAVKRGENTFSFAVGISRMLEYFTEGSSNFNNSIIPLQHNLWNSLQQASNPVFSNTDNLHMLMCIAAISNGFGAGTAVALHALQFKHNWILYPLLHELLYGFSFSEENYFRKQIWLGSARKMIESAPTGGIYSPRPDNSSVGWAADNRFLRNTDTQIKGKEHTENRLYNGLDYMLLHNLYHLADPGRWVDPLQEEFATDGLSINIFPNPLSGKLLFMQFDRDLNTSADIVLYDSFGREIIERNMKLRGDVVEILLPDLSDGLYFLSISIKDKVFVKKLNHSGSSLH